MKGNVGAMSDLRADFECVAWMRRGSGDEGGMRGGGI